MDGSRHQKLTFKPLSCRVGREVFSCGRHEIDHWFRKRAVDEHAKREPPVTTVHLAETDELVGFYAMCIKQEPERFLDKKQYRPQTVQSGQFIALSLHFLAVHKSYQRQGIGSAIMGRALSRFRRAAIEYGVQVMTLNAIDQEAVGFYERLGFIKCGPLQRYMLLPALSVLDLPDDETS